MPPQGLGGHSKGNSRHLGRKRSAGEKMEECPSRGRNPGKQVGEKAEDEGGGDPLCRGQRSESRLRLGAPSLALRSAQADRVTWKGMMTQIQFTDPRCLGD